MTEPLDSEISYYVWIQASKNWDKYKKLGPHPIHGGSHSDWPQWGAEYTAFFGFIGVNVHWANYPDTSQGTQISNSKTENGFFSAFPHTS